MDLSSDNLLAAIEAQLQLLSALPLAELLQRYGLLAPLIRRTVEDAIAESIALSEEQQAQLVAQLGAEATAEQQSELLRNTRLQRGLLQRYSEQIEPTFLEHRDKLERVAYSVIRLQDVGIAEELYLRLIDQEASFEDLALSFSMGDERHSGGRLPLMPIQQPHPQVQTALGRLSPGEVHPPLQLGEWVVLLRLDHRQPAELDDNLRRQLQQELFNRDLQELIETLTAALLPSELETPALATALAADNAVEEAE